MQCDFKSDVAGASNQIKTGLETHIYLKAFEKGCGRQKLFILYP